MDSENEVIIVDDIVATNGLNGHSEDLSEMKTRSKTSETEVLKSKVRSARNVGGQDKAGSDTEKKDKKVVESKPVAKDASATKPVSSQDKTSSACVTKKSVKPNEEQPIVLLPAKKRNTAEREDDSGINSRASSVSNEDATPRMRTRSSRTSDIASTSTPAKKGQGRMPLSTYDFEDITFDEDVSSAASLKRKAVLYVEEMEDADEEKQTDSEPAAKRPALLGSTNFFNVFLSPLRALRGKFTFRSQSANKVEAPTTEDTATPQTSSASKVDAEDTIKENVVSQPETSEEVSESTSASQTCRIM